MTHAHDSHGHAHHGHDSHGHDAHGPGGHAHGHGGGDAHDEHGHVHVMPLSILFSIFAALIVFTIATVVISKFHLGAWEVPITMAIATTKATLVAVYFMHLRYDNPFNAMIFCFSLFFVGLFLGGSLMDVRQYQKDLIPPPPTATPSEGPAPAAGEAAAPAAAAAPATPESPMPAAK